MKYSNTLDSGYLSKILYLSSSGDPDSTEMSNASKNGIFIGCSETSAIPVFIDFRSLINPHLFIVGMSGSGKTYLMKNLMLKLYSSMGSLVIMVDLTGEYKEFAELSGYSECTIESIPNKIYENEEGILYIDLKEAEEAEKINKAESLFGLVSRIMRVRESDGKHIFIILDEAWKLLSNSVCLEIIIREGRKFKIGLIFASQLIEDIALSMLANIATVFIFRTQNSYSLNKMLKNYNLKSCDMQKIQNLNVGSCLLIQLYKSSRRDSFVIKKISGINHVHILKIIFGGKMLEINRKDLEVSIRNLCQKDPSAFLSVLNQNGQVELQDLIKNLILLGSDRRSVLNLLRAMGIGDPELADAFAFAATEISESDEKSG